MSGPHQSVLLGPLCALTACIGGLQTPPVGDARAELLLIDRGDGRFSVYAADPTVAQVLPVPLEELKGRTAYALMFRCQLPKLGLLAGEVPIASGVGPRRALPKAGRVFTAVLGGRGAWQPIDALPPEVAALELGLEAPQRPSQC